MKELKGLNGESLVLDGGWLEKLRGGSTSVARIPVDRFQDARVDSVTRKKFVAFGAKEELLVLTIQAGQFMGLQLPAEKRAEVDAFLDAVRTAAAAAPAGSA